MQLNEYQNAAMALAVYPDQGNNIEYPSLGLAGECGEVCNQVKKIRRDDKGVITLERRQKLIDELGDTLWYISACANELSVSLEVIAQFNLEKLNARAKEDTLHGDRRSGT